MLDLGMILNTKTREENLQDNKEMNDDPTTQVEKELNMSGRVLICMTWYYVDMRVASRVMPNME